MRSVSEDRLRSMESQLAELQQDRRRRRVTSAVVVLACATLVAHH